MQSDIDIVTGRELKWVHEINIDFGEVIKKTGNGAIHTNGEDISKTGRDYEMVDIVFAELLDKIYEQLMSRAGN